jgi:hypothetical protein
MRLSRKARGSLLIGSLLCITATVIALFFARRPAEPRYDGRPLSAWLDVLGKDPDATNALRAMVPAALPFLVADLRPRVGDVERGIWSWAHTRGIKTDLKIDRRWKAIDAFHVLGSAASPAIPDVISLLGDSNTQNNASAALSGIGSEAVGPLVVALTNRRPEIRIGVARTLGERPRFDAQLAIPALLRGLRDEDWRVRAVSAESLGRLRKAPELTVQPLVACLQDTSAVVRASAAIGLRLFGAGAKAAVPALKTAAANEKNEDARREAESAAMQIDPSTAR